MSSGFHKHFRVRICRRVLIVAALFWSLRQMTWIPEENDSTIDISPKKRRLLYVHIGKTGGEFIKSQLSVTCKTRKNSYLKQTCLDKFQKRQQLGQESQLSQQTVGYLHTHNLYPRNGYGLATHFLFSVRHPLSRLVSWYVYNHPQSCDPREANSPSCKTSEWKTQFFQCFPTLRHLEGPSWPGNCSDVFWDGWNARRVNAKDPNHLYWNYEFYWNETQSRAPRKPILVVRQESLQQDLDNLELFLSGSATTTWHAEDSAHFVTGRVTAFLLPQTAQQLCCLLEPELSIYQQILQRAENLSNQAKQGSLESISRICGDWNRTDCRGQPRGKRTP